MGSVQKKEEEEEEKEEEEEEASFLQLFRSANCEIITIIL